MLPLLCCCPGRYYKSAAAAAVAAATAAVYIATLAGTANSRGGGVGRNERDGQQLQTQPTTDVKPSCNLWPIQTGESQPTQRVAHVPGKRNSVGIFGEIDKGRKDINTPARAL